MFLICGLGNPGVRYKDTRHNVGFKLADQIIHYYDFTILRANKESELFSGNINNKKVLIVKPLTFMNLSGKTVMEIINFYKIKKNNLFVIHDDLDLKLAKIKIKKGGRNGGHNGLSSIDQYLGEEYNRIRIGIDHPGHKDLVSKYVLNKFSNEEVEVLDKKFEKVVTNLSYIFIDIPFFLTKISVK